MMMFARCNKCVGLRNMRGSVSTNALVRRTYGAISVKDYWCARPNGENYAECRLGKNGWISEEET